MPMVAGTTDSSSTTGATEREFSCKKDASLREILSEISLKDRVAWKAKTDRDIVVPGSTISNTVRDNFPGLTEISTEDSIKTESGMVLD